MTKAEVLALLCDRSGFGRPPLIVPTPSTLRRSAIAVAFNDILYCGNDIGLARWLHEPHGRAAQATQVSFRPNPFVTGNNHDRQFGLSGPQVSDDTLTCVIPVKFNVNDSDV